MMYSKQIALVGCGNWGKNIARSLGELGALAALCEDRDQCAQTQDLSAQFSAPILSFEAILADPKITGVAIATPTATHYSLARACLEAGKHVFVEKPLVQQLEENQELCALAKRQNKVLMVGHILRYHPGYLMVQKKCLAGDIGQIQHVSTRRANLGRFFPGESALWDLAPHDLSMVLGLFNRLPERVSAHEQAYVEPGIGDFATLDLDFGNGQNAHLYFSRYSPVKEQKLMVYGPNGFLEFDDTRSWAEKAMHFHSTVRQEKGGPVIHPGPVESCPLTDQEPLKCELKAFMEAMQTPEINQSSGTDAQDILMIILAAERSLKSQTWEPL